MNLEVFTLRIISQTVELAGSAALIGPWKQNTVERVPVLDVLVGHCEFKQNMAFVHLGGDVEMVQEGSRSPEDCDSARWT